MRDPCAKLLWISVLLTILVGCIRPIEETPTPTSGPPGVTTTSPQPTNSTSPRSTPLTPGEISEADYPVIEDYLRRVGKIVTPGTLNHWREVPVGGELVIGIDFLNPSGLPCTGAVMARREFSGALNVYNGEAQCATEPSAAAVGGNWLVIAWESQQPYTLTAAQIFSPSAPVSEALIVFQDNSALRATVVEGHTLYVRPDSTLARQVQFLDQSGNSIYTATIP